MKYPAKNPAKFLKPEPEPDIETGNPAGSGFSRISGRFLGVAVPQVPVGTRSTEPPLKFGHGP